MAVDLAGRTESAAGLGLLGDKGLNLSGQIGRSGGANGAAPGGDLLKMVTEACKDTAGRLAAGPACALNGVRDTRNAPPNGSPAQPAAAPAVPAAATPAPAAAPRIISAPAPVAPAAAKAPATVDVGDNDKAKKYAAFKTLTGREPTDAEKEVLDDGPVNVKYGSARAKMPPTPSGSDASNPPATSSETSDTAADSNRKFFQLPTPDLVEGKVDREPRLKAISDYLYPGDEYKVDGSKVPGMQLRPPSQDVTPDIWAPTYMEELPCSTKLMGRLMLPSEETEK